MIILIFPLYSKNVIVSWRSTGTFWHKPQTDNGILMGEKWVKMSFCEGMIHMREQVGVCVCLCVCSVCPLCPCIVPHIVFLHKKSWPDKVLRAVKIMPCLYVFISPWQFNYFWPHWRKPHKKLTVFVQILIRNAGKLKQSCFKMLSFFQGLVVELCLNQHKRK